MLAVIGVALLVGLVNATLVLVFRLASVLATLATYIVIQGVSLLLRSEPGGYYRPGRDGERCRRRGAGCRSRSSPRACSPWRPSSCSATRAPGLAAPGGRLGRGARAPARRPRQPDARRPRTCSARSSPPPAASCSARQVGVGDPRVGVSYTLTSITAVVLGGASIFGGRGSFIGALLGAVLIQEVVTATTFLQIGIAWQYYLPGALILVGAGVYSRARARTLGAAPEPA